MSKFSVKIEKALENYPSPKTQVQEFREYFGKDAELAALLGFTWFPAMNDQESG